MMTKAGAYRLLRSGLVLIGLALFVAGCSAESEGPQIQRFEGQIMGTYYHVAVVGQRDEQALSELADQVHEVLADVDHKMSTWKPDSELSRFNRAPADQWFNVSQETYHVVAEAQRIADLTQGRYDVTVEPLVNLWGFGPDRHPDRVPSDTEIQQAFKKIGYTHLTLDPSGPMLRKEVSGLEVDLSSIAKGYGVDQVADWLESHGIHDYLVEVGGEIRASGERPGLSQGEGVIPWRIGIERPVSSSQSIQLVVPVSHYAVATSGDYRNYFEEDGVRYSHTIDPATGRPITHRLASVTVVTKSCMTADAWATALTVLGDQAGMALAEQENLSVYMIVKTDDGFKVEMSSAFKKQFSEALVAHQKAQP
ncbi:FAD:protein FMN transferase [Terasakiispira papahanaumokuakeensis]|nr:FAD:protein FMN transferase [Terasakiispira papahanaumokuakeensis]